MKLSIILFIVVLFLSCSKEPNSLEQYIEYPVKFARKKIVHPSKDFSIEIPKDWQWEIRQNGYMEELILGIDAVSKENENGFRDEIIIEKLRSSKNENYLTFEYEDWLKGMNENLGENKIVEFGLSQFMNQDTYFIHSKYDYEAIGMVESIHLFIESEKENTFYMLTINVSEKRELNKKMAILVKCLKTFKNLNKNNVQLRQ